MEVDQTQPQLDSQRAARLEIAHVLFADIVGYSRLPMDEQTKVLGLLQQIVSGTREFREAQAKDQLISLPTGDGMALVFFGSPEDPVECAVEVSRALRNYPDLKLRMGVHSGPVYRVADINANRNVAGGGINTAQRVMDCGDSGHILVSKAVAETLGQLSGWEGKLRNLGEAEVKHGVRVHLFNLYSVEFGNPDVPQKLQEAWAPSGQASHLSPSTGRPIKRVKRRKLGIAVAAAAVAALTLAALAYFYLPRGGAISSLAVLPLANAGNDPDAEYLSDGLTESLINSLSQLPQVKVIAMSSVMRYKGQQADPQQVGRELGVGAVLTGRIVQRGDGLAISTELVDAGSRSRLWGERYERKLSDLIALRGEIAQDVAEKLRLRLTGEQRGRLTRRHTEDPEAYQLYLKGRFFWNRRTGESISESIRYFNRATERDPSYALAYAGLADAYVVLPSHSNAPASETHPKAKAAAQRALELDGTLGEAFTTLASVKLEYDWDFAGAERDYRQAIALSPNYATAHQWYGEYLSAMGRGEESLAELRRARELDPLSIIINGELGFQLMIARRYDEAIAQLRKTLELDADFAPAHKDLGWCYLRKGAVGEAVAEFRKAVALSNDGAFELSQFASALAQSGRQGEAREILGRLRERRQREYVDWADIAYVQAALGERDEAFASLESAYREHSFKLTLLKREPALDDGFRADPRFQNLVRRVGLPQ